MTITTAAPLTSTDERPSHRTHVRATVTRVRRIAGRADRRLLAAAAALRTPPVDAAMTRASTAANRSMLWSAIAAALWATGRRRPRTAAAGGMLGIGFATTLVNGPLKLLWRRDRPPTEVPPLLPLPRTFSFPSGHAASAAAFATAVTRALPAAGPVVLPLAGAVAYSRVHTGVHYPSDVVVGAAVGAASGAVAAGVVRGLRERSVVHTEARPSGGTVPTRAVLLANDKSGSAGGLGLARRILEERGIAIERVVPVQDAAVLDQLVRAPGAPPLVIAAGGDGTVGSAANAVVGTDVVLGVVPLGTSNDVARSMGIPPDPVEAAHALAGGWVGRVDAGEMRVGGDRLVFMNAATAGLNVAFAQIAGDGRIRDRFGALTYPVAAARAVRGYEPFACTVTRDGVSETLDVVHLSVSNAPVFGGLLGFRVPGASMTDGLLDVIVVERLSLTRLAYAVADTVVDRHAPVRRVHAYRAERLDIAASSPQEVALDGEVIGRLPVSFQVLPEALRVVLPATG